MQDSWPRLPTGTTVTEKIDLINAIQDDLDGNVNFCANLAELAQKRAERDILSQRINALNSFLSKSTFGHGCAIEATESDVNKIRGILVTCYAELDGVESRIKTLTAINSAMEHDAVATHYKKICSKVTNISVPSDR